MRFKRVLPYVLLGSGLLIISNSSQSNSKEKLTEKQVKTIKNVLSTHFETTLPKTFFPITYNADLEKEVKEYYVEKKSSELRDRYVSNMLAAQKRLEPLLGTGRYRAAVRKELPGAPVGYHCVYGQYTQLSKALKEMGDTLTIIPDGASSACWQFKDQMRKKYSGSEYSNCIHEGKMFETDEAYNSALKSFLDKQKNLTDSLRLKLVNDFSHKNFSAQSLEPGTMLVVPRFRGSKNLFHMIMFLGRGRIENGNFIPDEKGEYMYTGHNNEKIGDLFKTCDTSNVFAADTRNIAKVEYEKEYNSISHMNRDALVTYLNKDEIVNDITLNSLPESLLLQMAKNKYLKNYLSKYMPQNTGIMTPSNIHNIILANKKQHSI